MTTIDITRGIVFNLEDGGAVLRLGYTLSFADPHSPVAAVITPVEQFILVDRSQLPAPEKLRRIELAVQANFIGHPMIVGVDYNHFYSINYSYKPQKSVISPAPSPKPGNSAAAPAERVVRPVRTVQPVVIRRAQPI